MLKSVADIDGAFKNEKTCLRVLRCE